MEDIKVKKFGPSCGKHGSNVFYKAFKYKKDGKGKIISLGHFFFMKIFESIPICIGELQLVWEDKNSATDLVSVRLYFLPECTPEGRQPSHGEDEVLAYYEKIVLKLSDMASMIVHDVSWSDGRRAFCVSGNDKTEEYPELAEAFRMNSYGLDNRDIEKEKLDSESKEKIEDSSPEVVVMTYPHYCRYRCMLKRLENCEDKWLKNALVCALGGFSSAVENNRVYFCRDVFEHGDLDDFELRCDHLAPAMKGRTKKRKGSKLEANDSDESSSSSSFSSQQEPSVNKVRTGSRATPLRNGFRIDKIKVSKDEQAFLIDLHKFMKSRNTPIGRIPSLGFKQIDLFQFYCLAEDIGGYEQISNKRMWKHLYDKLGGNPGFTSAATCTRRHYEKLLLPYEQYRRAQEGKHKKKAKSESDLPSVNKVSIKTDGKNEKLHSKDKENKQNIEKKDIKADTKIPVEIKPLVNGKPEAGNKIKQEKADTAAIIKREIEKMKMRKAEKKQGASILSKPKTKATGTIVKKKHSEGDGRKLRLGEKGRRPSGSQKTVRELLHQNGQEVPYSLNEKSSEVLSEHNQSVIQKEVKTFNQSVIKNNEKEINDVNTANSAQSSTPKAVSVLDTKPVMSQNMMGSMSQPPVFYPQIIPVGSNMRSLTPIAMPFMIPQYGFQPLTGAVPPLSAFGSVPGMKDEKPLHALNKLVSEQSVPHSASKSAISSHHSRSTPSILAPLSAGHGHRSSCSVTSPSTHHSRSTSSLLTAPSAHHSRSTPSIITPPSAHSGSKRSLSPHSVPDLHRPIGPAHSNLYKRPYPTSDSNKSHIAHSSTVACGSRNIKEEPSDLKRPKFSPSVDKLYKSTNDFDGHALDFSMKTLRAQESRHQRGESLLFNTSFSKDRSVPKVEPTDGPQDLSLKPKTGAGSGSFGPMGGHKNVPLNIPYHRIPSSSPSGKKDDEMRKQRVDIQSPASSKPVLPISSGGISTIGGLPIDLGSFVHPAFPQQMLMPGMFPTPLQLQQMIQGQVAASLPMLRPEFMPSPLMFPPSMSVMAPTMFSGVVPSIGKTNVSSPSVLKR